jgi:hypothetical protein
MPKMKFISNAKPSLFSYPEALKPPKKEEREKVENHSVHFLRKKKKVLLFEECVVALIAALLKHFIFCPILFCSSCFR